MLKQFETILFDADRTLFDTGAMETKALRQLMEELHLPFDPEMPRVYYEINEDLWRRIETGELTRPFVRVERFRKMKELYRLPGTPEELNRRYLELFQVCNLLLPGAEEVCRILSKTKRLAIITNGSASVQKTRFAISAVTAYCSGVYVSEDVGIPKPQKGFFDAVMRDMNITDPKKILIVGDSLTSDIKGGNNAGIPTCWYNPNGEENNTDVVCDFEITDLRQLLTMD